PHDELASFHVWMAPAWQEIIWRAAQRSLAVMCPACWCSPGGLLALMGRSGCCARAASGHAAAAPPSSVMNSRRFIRSPRRRARAALAEFILDAGAVTGKPTCGDVFA